MSLAGFDLADLFVAFAIVLKVDQDVLAFDDGLVAREPAPRLEQDLRFRLVIFQAAALDLHELGVGTNGLPIHLDVAFHEELAGGGIVGGAGGRAVAMLELEGRRTVGFRAPLVS